jgi:hypothetical protein
MGISQRRPTIQYRLPKEEKGAIGSATSLRPGRLEFRRRRELDRSLIRFQTRVTVGATNAASVRDLLTATRSWILRHDQGLIVE